MFIARIYTVGIVLPVIVSTKIIMSFVGDNFSLELQANVNWNSIGSSHLKLKPRGLRIRRGAPCFFSWEVGVGRRKGEIKSNSIIFWLLFVLT